MTIVLATRNKGKIREFTRLLAGRQVRSCATYTGCPEPEEIGETFTENAIIKARAVADFTGAVTLADDSGLEVDALGGAPGVYSARFAGPDATDEQNRLKLLDHLKAVMDADRTARFRCIIAIATPDGEIQTADGVCEGRIGWQEKGNKGFGYDPLFIPDGFSQTFAELGTEIKNGISHRAMALEGTLAILNRLAG